MSTPLTDAVENETVIYSFQKALRLMTEHAQKLENRNQVMETLLKDFEKAVMSWLPSDEEVRTNSKAADMYHLHNRIIQILHRP